jgi:O-antigen ligase
LILGLSILPPSTTRLQVWPWAGFAALAWFIPISVALYRLALNRPACRFGGLIDAGTGLLALAAMTSAFASPLRGVVMPHLLPFLGACALPYALLPINHTADGRLIERIGGGLIAIILGASLLLWWEPWLHVALPDSRNAQPFGHANITGSVAVLAATWFAAAALREKTRLPRLLFAAGSLLAIITMLSSGSRGSVIALATAVSIAAAIMLLRHGRLLIAILLALVLAGSVISTNAQLRELVIHGRWHASVRESNDQRTAMIVGGLRLGAERPLLGWGPGSVPHVFPRVRAELPGTADNFLQLHNTPVQLWTTLGSAGLIAALLIMIGLVGRLRSSVWTNEYIAETAGLIATATVLLFDHAFATPLFALLAAAQLSAWAGRNNAQNVRITSTASASATRQRIIGVSGAVLLLPTLIASRHDLAARREFDTAIDMATRNDREGYAAHLGQASQNAPADPYYRHLLASYFATGHPFPDAPTSAPENSIRLLQDTLRNNPDLEYAHYNLGWLLLDSDPSSAARHFRESARLAPQRGEVYYGLGLARIRMKDTDGALRAFATEWLLNPATAWSPIWTHPPLDTLRPDIRTLASRFAMPRNAGIDPWSRLGTPAPEGSAYRRMRAGYGVLMGHPDGLLPVDFNIQRPATLPPEMKTGVPKFGWLPGTVLLEFLDIPSI